jgi:hypothetical protein
MPTPLQDAQAIFQAATPVLKIHGVGGKRWRRNVASGGRIGPWLQGSYEVLDEKAWHRLEACLYLVAGSDLRIRYVGISRKRLKDRWRVSPALDAETMAALPERQIFHSQCWKHIEIESTTSPGATFEVRAIHASVLVPLLEQMGGPLSGFTVLKDDGESVVAGVERWLCNNSSDDLVSWNTAMTGRAGRR